MYRLFVIIFTAAMTGLIFCLAAEELDTIGFEQGFQDIWVGRPEAVRIDASDSSEGKQCAVFDPGGRIAEIARGIKLRRNEIYTVKFDARSTSPGGGAPEIQVRLLMRSLKKPIDWFKEAGKASAELNVPTALRGEWQTFSCSFGPLPDTWRDAEVSSVNLYFQILPGKKPGKVLLDNIRISTRPAVETKPEISFLLPDPVRIFDRIPDFKVKRSGRAGVLRVTARNAGGEETLKLQGVPGEGSLAVTLPGPDYYDIAAEVVDGTKILASARTSVVVTTPLPDDYYSTPHPAFGVWCQVDDRMHRLGGGKWTRHTLFTYFPSANGGTPPSPEKVATRSPVKVITNVNIPHRPHSAEELAEQRRKLEREMIARRGLVDIWETQNEPMLGENFHGTMQQAADIMAMQSSIARQIVPGVPVAGICLNPMQKNHFLQYLNYYRNCGIDRQIDMLALHPYIPGAQSPDTSGYVETINRLRKEVSKIAGREIPVFISEIGYSTKPGGEVTELQQAAYLARVAMLNRQIPGLVGCVWHNGVWTEAYSRREYDFGIMKGVKGSSIREPKPAFAAWATVSRQTWNADYLRELDFGRNVRVLLFRRNGKPLLALWGLQGEPVSVRLPLNVPEVTVVELCGRSRRVRLADGVLPLSLGEAPVYVSGDFPAIFDERSFAVAMEPEVPAALAGMPFEFQVRLPGHFSSAELRIPAGEYGTAQVTGSGADRTVKIIPAPGIRPGCYDLELRLEENGRPRSILIRQLEILRPVDFSRVAPVAVPQGRAILCTAEFRDSTAGDATVEILENGNRVIGLARLSAPGVSVIPLYLTRIGRRNSYSARFTLSDGSSYVQPLGGGLTPVSIPYFRDALDRVEEWPECGRFAIGDGVASSHGLTGENDRPSGVIRLAWDEDFLYYAVDVNDKTCRTVALPADMWQGDSLQCGIAADPQFMIRPNNDGLQETAYNEFGTDLRDGGSRSWTWASMNRNAMPCNRPVPGIRLDHCRDRTWTFYRAAVPWETLNIRPGEGVPLRLSILVNDSDGGVRHWMEWFGGIADGKDPGLYGSAVLTKQDRQP